MSSSQFFSCKVNMEKPFHIYNSKKFAKQPFLIIKSDSEIHPSNSQSNGLLVEEEGYNQDFSRKPPFSTSNNVLPLLQPPVNQYQAHMKPISDPAYLQSLTLQLSLLKQQNQNKYFVNYNGNSSSNLSNNEQNYGFNQFPGNFMFQEKEKILSSLTIPDSVVRKMSSNAINTKFIDKPNKNYKVISKSPELRKSFLRKNSKKDGNLSMDDNKSIDGFLSDAEESKENRPIFDLKHLPSPSSGKLINYDDLTIYKENDECLELEDEDDCKKSYASKDFPV